VKFLVAVVIFTVTIFATAAAATPGGGTIFRGAPFLSRETGDEPDAKAVALGVRHKGYWSGAPIGVSACAGCHQDVAAQWATSAHRFSSFNNPYYRVSVEDFRKERGNQPSRFCASCHEPSLLRPGSDGKVAVDGKVDIASREAQAGLTCLVCHSITEVPSLEGNGAMVIDVRPVPTAKGPHGARVRPPILSESKLCGTCHKVGLEPEITQDRFIRGQDDYDPWQTAGISGHGAAAVWRPATATTCQGCHMPLEKAVLGDAVARAPGRAANQLGLVRSHRFLGANTALPHLRSDAESEALQSAFLRGAVTVDLAWQDTRHLDVVLRARRIGHRFPGGTMDSNEAWIEVDALDSNGKRVAVSGDLDAAGVLEGSAHLIRAQAVDADGEPLRRRDPQHMRGVAFDTSLAPSDPQAVRFELPDASAVRVVKVRVRLLYRKFTAPYAARACELVSQPDRARCRALPIVEVDSAELAIGAKPSADWSRLVDRGLALAAALADRASEAQPWLERALAEKPDRPEPLLGLGRLMMTLGRTDDAVAFARRAARLSPQHPAAAYIEASSLEKAYRQAEARPAAERLLSLLPDDRMALGLAARVRGVLHDTEGSLTAADRLIAVDPFVDEGWYQRALSLMELGRFDDAAQAQTQYLYRRTATEIDLSLRDKLRQRRDSDESVPVHTHPLREVTP